MIDIFAVFLGAHEGCSLLDRPNGNVIVVGLCRPLYEVMCINVYRSDAWVTGGLAQESSFRNSILELGRGLPSCDSSEKSDI